MIPTIPTLESAAEGVLRSIPGGLTHGAVSTGLYGVGFLGRWALPRLKQRGVRLVSCHDANEALRGTCIDGVPVQAAADLRSGAPEFVIVTARHAVRPVSDMLSGAGIPHVSYDAWHAAADFAAFRNVHDRVLGDERSREVLRAVLMAMLTGDNRHCEAVFEGSQYFCLPRFCGSDKEHYVDAGAYVGDSVERFIWSHGGAFSQIHAFEPGRRPFAALQARMARLTTEWALDPATVHLVNAALGETERAANASSSNGRMTSFALGHATDAGGTHVDVASLDRRLRDGRVTFLKADVEGMELELLKGARSLIQDQRPKLAICVYHYPADLIEIAGYLAGLVPEYRFALRHHSPQMMETVLYCWIE